MTDHTGAIIWKAEYKAWGECKAEKAKSSFFENSEIISNNIRFQGQYFDQETGLHYNRYRYYSPFVGRFVSKDPIGLSGGSNNYAYVPNPTSWVDPNGLTCQKYRRESLREIRRKLGIPMSQQPISQKMVPLTDKNGKRILNDKNMPIMTREMTYSANGKIVIIQDHSAGHDFGEADGTGNQPSHHNVRPPDNTRTGNVEGMDDHYYFDCRNRK